MGLQEGLILLGAVVFLIVLLDAIRRKRAAARRQEDDYEDPEEIERRAQIARELPSLELDGKKPTSQQGLDPLFDDIEVFDDDPIPVLRNKQTLSPITQEAPVIDEPFIDEATTEPLAELESTAEEDDATSDEELAWDKMRRMFALDPAFAEASRSSMEIQQKELQQLQEKKELLVQEQEENERFEQQALERETLDNKAPVFDNLDDLVELEHPARNKPAAQVIAEQPQPEEPLELVEETIEFDPEEQEKVLRAALLSSLEKSAWGSSEIFLTINVNAPEDKPFVGSHLCRFMDMIGMKLSESGFYHYVEATEIQSYLGYSLVNMFSPGNFDPTAEDDFSTEGVVLVMPLPNTPRPMAVFERMLATAKVMEKNWNAELQDEQRSNLTQQTIEHYRQTIKDFEYQTRVNAKKAGRA